MAVYTESRQLIDLHTSQSLVSSRKIEPDKQRIPIVGHIITDQDIGAVEGNKLQPVSLSRVAKLLTDPHSVHLYDRHVHALRKVAKHYQDGFLLKDLVPLLKILNVCADRSPTQRLYLEPMVELLLLCGLPFLKEKSSNEKAYEKIAVDSITQIGYLMRVNSSKVRRQICQSLISLYDSKQPPHKVQGLKPCDPSFNRAIIEQSQVAQSIIKSLQLIDDDPAMKLEIIKLLQKLSKQSPETCSKMLEVEAAKVVCSQLVSGSSQQGQGQRDVGELVFRSVEVLWNLLQDGEAKMVARQLNDFDCIRQLQEAFLNQLTSGYSVYDHQLRNDILVILCLVATHCPTAPFLETQFSKQLVLLTTFQEVKSHNALVKHLKLSACSEDFEMKKLLVTLIVSLSADRAVLRQYSEGRLLLALFSYVRANDPSVVSSYEWSAAQFEEIQLHVMSALCTLCPLLLDDHMACQGNTRILLLIEWCIAAGDHCGGKGNSFYGSGTYKTKRAQLQLCVRLLYSVASTNYLTLLQDLADQGVIHQLTNILAGLQGVSPGKSMDDEADVTLQTDMLHTLAAVCDEDIHRKELFGNSGIDVLINYLKMDLRQLTLGLGHHRLLLAAVDAVWSCVCGCLTSEDYFLEREGAFLMLDLLESCPHEFRNVIIGCLMDLMENPKLIAHAMTWHSKQRPIVSIANLFCQLWRDEEALMGVQRDERGVIISTGVTEPKTSEMHGDDEGGLANGETSLLGGTARRPLVGTVQQSQGVISQAASAISPAIADVYDNIRSKIFAMFNKIGFVDLPGLTAEDHVTLTIVEHYLDFKIGEVWAETMAELAMEAVRPVTADREALEVINRTSSDRVDHVVNIQHELLNAQLAQDLQEEQQFYARIRESFRQSEKARNDFDKYVERTSNYAKLKEAKALQDDMIDASRVQIKTNEPFTHHNVDIRNLTTTAFSGRHVTVHSTPAEMVGNSLTSSLGITALTSQTEEYETNYDTDRDVITFASP